MVYTYTVTLEGIKGFRRVYRLNPETTLYEFHKKMVSDMDFPRDQLMLFKALNAGGGVAARYGMFDLGNGTVDEVTLGKTVEDGIRSFVYFYDAINKKKVIVTFESEDEEAAPLPGPVLDPSFNKGPNPVEFENGYIAYEDLPDDQKHLPGESLWKKKFADEDSGGDDDDDIDTDEDGDDPDEEDDDEDGKEIYDESEGINL